MKKIPRERGIRNRIIMNGRETLQLEAVSFSDAALSAVSVFPAAKPKEVYDVAGSWSYRQEPMDGLEPSAC